MTEVSKRMCPWTDRKRKDDRQLEMFRRETYQPDLRKPKWFRLREAPRHGQREAITLQAGTVLAVRR